MPRSPSDFSQAGSNALSFATLGRPIAEWAFWILLALIAYSQTGNFSEDIADYAFGASGWPRALCLAIVLGATGQLAYQALTISRSGASAPSDDYKTEPGDSKRLTGWRLVQRLGVFVLPLIYLYVMPSIGFYVATPLFILAFLVLLEVKSPIALVTVTLVVYGLVLLIFTRLFYVALPLGNVESFYNISNAIIEIVRSGM